MSKALSAQFVGACFLGASVAHCCAQGTFQKEEPELKHVNDASIYFRLWAGGKSFAICAWSSRGTPYFQALGDPFVTR